LDELGRYTKTDEQVPSISPDTGGESISPEFGRPTDWALLKFLPIMKFSLASNSSSCLLTLIPMLSKSQYDLENEFCWSLLCMGSQEESHLHPSKKHVVEILTVLDS